MCQYMMIDWMRWIHSQSVLAELQQRYLIEFGGLPFTNWSISLPSKAPNKTPDHKPASIQHTSAFENSLIGGGPGSEYVGEGGPLTSSVEWYEGGLSTSREFDSKEGGLRSTDIGGWGSKEPGCWRRQLYSLLGLSRCCFSRCCFRCPFRDRCTLKRWE